MIPIILDMDPGIDDAVALSIALTNPNFDIKLLTSVAGNVSVDKTTANLLKLTTFLIDKKYLLPRVHQSLSKGVC